MTKKSSTPAIRFKGFSDTWEQRKLWELTIWDKKFNEVEAEKQPKIIKYPYVLADVFSKIEDASGDVRLLSTGNYIGYTTDEKAGKNLCVGEVVAIPWGGVPNIKYYKGKFVTADNRIATSNDTETLGNRFLSLYLEHNLAFLQSIYRGASIKHPSMSDVLSIQISIPHIQEQREIENWFANLENLITLHQRKYDKLTNVKKSMLEKMFPKNGSNVPEIRFKGFTEAWEQRKLGDMMNVTSVKRIHQSDWTDSGVRFLRARDIVAAAKNEEPDDYLYISKEKYEEYSALSGKVGVSDLLVTGVGTIGVPYLVRNLEPLYFKDGNIIWFQNSSKIDGKFLFYSFSAEQIQGFINESAGIGTVGTYTIESGKKTPISLPNQIEQARVGEFFQQLDNLITLHQRELEKLKNLKKACLEKMFV